MAWIRKHQGSRGRTYRVHWRDPEGRERSKTFPRRREAEEFSADVDSDLRRGGYRDPRAGRRPLGPYLESYLAGAVDLRPATAALYRSCADRYILPRLRAVPIGSLAPAEVRSFIGHLVEEGARPPTVQVVHRLLRRVLREAVDDGLIVSNPAAGVSLPRVERKPPRILDPVEVERLADAIDDRYRALVLLGAYGGLRFGECAALRRGRVRLLERRVEIREALTDVGGKVAFGPTKTGAARSVAIPPFLAEELARHMASFPPPPGSDLLFTGRDGSPVRRTNFRRRQWDRAVARAGILPPPGFHDLRHTSAAISIAEGAHPKAIQARLGHASIRTTLDVYGSLFPTLDDELAERLERTRESARAEHLRNDSASVVVPLATGAS
jgi:integrase